MRRFALALLAACSHPKPEPPPVAKPPDRCAQIADHVVSLMTAAQKVDSSELDPYRNVISKRCTEDHWSAEMQDCLGTIQTLRDGDACEKFLTPAQFRAFQNDGMAAVNAMNKGSAE